MELTYTMQGDYLLPDLTVPESPTLGKYGMLRRSYLKDHRDGIYTGMLLTGKLDEHLKEIGDTAQEMFDRLVAQMKDTEGVTERLKAENQMEWVGRMNSIRSRAEEVVLSELVYC